MRMCSQNTAFFYIDDHELTPIKRKSQDFSIEIIGQAASSKNSISLQLSLPHSWEFVHFSGQRFTALDITDPNTFYPGLGFFSPPASDSWRGEAAFAVNSPRSKTHRLESFGSSILTLWRPVSSLLDANTSFGFCLECAQSAGLPVTQKDRGRANRLWFWMMGKHHSKDDVWIVPSCTRDLEMGTVIHFTNGGQRQGKGSGWQLPAMVWGNSEPWHDCSPLPHWPVYQPLVTSFLTRIRHQLWLSLGILIMGRYALVEQASQLKEGAQERTAKFSDRSACSEAPIWTIPLSSTPTAFPAGLWWQHAPALKHRAQWQHRNNSRVNMSWRYTTFRGACVVSLPNDPSYGCCLQIHPLGKQFGWAKIFRDAKPVIKLSNSYTPSVT